MQIKCQSCGASHNTNEGQECSFCGSIITANQEIKNRIDKLNANGNLFKLAEVAFEGSDFDEAINYYNKCLEIDSDFFEAWYKKGLSIFQTSTIGNLKSTQAISSIKTAINESPEKECFKTRIKKDLIPIIINYIHVSLEHYISFRNLSGTGPEFASKIIKTNDVTEFLIANSNLSIKEIKLLYDTYKAAVKKIQTGVALAEIGSKNNSGVVHAYKPLLEMEEKLRVIWAAKSPNDAPSKRACFIATAAMGDYNHPVVMDLRIFRDNWLLKRKWGVSFTNWYYKHGPKAAGIIENSLMLRKLTYIFIIMPLHRITKNLK